MKRITSLLSILIVCLALPCYAQAQSPKELQDNFVNLYSQPGDKTQAFNALYLTHKANIELLQSAPKGSEQYNQARQALMQMWPALEAAAVFYSSKGHTNNAIYMAQAYIELPMNEHFRGVEFNYSTNRAQLAYYVGSRYFNNRDYQKSIPFLNEYLKTGDEKNRKNVFICLIKACTETNNTQLGRTVLDEAARSYPTDYDLMSRGVNLCLESQDWEGLQFYLDKAKALRPNDPTILNIQAKLYEDTRNYDKALDTYMSMLKGNPNSLEINKHVALNYYNMGALRSNKAATETDQKSRKDLQKQASDCFTKAIPYLEKVVGLETGSLKYNTALAICYGQTGKKDKLADQNQKVAALGGGTITENTLPQLMQFAGGGAASFDAFAQQTSSAGASTQQQPAVVDVANRPKFSEFAKSMIEGTIAQWQQKDPYETADEYRQRVTEETRNKKVAELTKAAENEYIRLYARGVNIQDFNLKPYDAENGVFLIDGAMGQLVLPVPRANNEARLFEQNWNGIALKDPRFFIANDGLAIAEVTFVTPTGMSYRYNNDAALTYTQTTVNVKFDDIDYTGIAQNTGRTNNPVVQTREVSIGNSDVDVDIPVNKQDNTKTFALIISNENYQMVSKVPSALNDGTTFSEYCKKTLGLPEHNVMHYKDASYGMMLAAMKQLRDIADAYQNDEFNVIFYYAGHGIPNEATKDGFLLPTDANGQQTEVCYPLSKLYSELSNLGAKSVVTFLDACFSGAKREGDMIASARGVAIVAKKETPKGNMVSFSAATGDETAYPYTEKNHGLFTYYLLKKLQESKGNVTLKELGDYITDNVKKQSVVINHKSQTPTVTPSEALAGTWHNLKLR